MCWVLGLAHNKYKRSPQDSRLTSREEKKKIRHLWNLNRKMPYSFQRKKSLQSLGDRMRILVFKLLTNSCPLEKERFLCLVIFWKGAVCGLLLWIFSFSFLSAPKGAFGCLLGHWLTLPWEACGWPTAPGTGGWVCPNLIGGVRKPMEAGCLSHIL